MWQLNNVRTLCCMVYYFFVHIAMCVSYNVPKCLHTVASRYDSCTIVASGFDFTKEKLNRNDSDSEHSCKIRLGSDQRNRTVLVHHGWMNKIVLEQCYMVGEIEFDEKRSEDVD